MPGVGEIAGVERLMVLEEGELGAFGEGMVLKWLKMPWPTLTFVVALMVLSAVDFGIFSALEVLER